MASTQDVWTEGATRTNTAVSTTEATLTINERRRATKTNGVTKIRLDDFKAITFHALVSNAGANTAEFKIYGSVTGTGTPTTSGEPDKHWKLLETVSTVANNKAAFLTYINGSDGHFQYFAITGKSSASTIDADVTWAATTR